MNNLKQQEEDDQDAGEADGAKVTKAKRLKAAKALKMYTDIEDPESRRRSKKQGLVQTNKLRLSGIGP